MAENGPLLNAADFWTTKCTRCPMAIMKLNRMAAEPVYKDKVVFMTVNCDECVRVLSYSALARLLATAL